MAAKEENNKNVKLKFAKILAKDKEFFLCGNNFHRNLYLKQNYPEIAQLPFGLLNEVIEIAKNIAYENRI